MDFSELGFVVSDKWIHPAVVRIPTAGDDAVYATWTNGQNILVVRTTDLALVEIKASIAVDGLSDLSRNMLTVKLSRVGMLDKIVEALQIRMGSPCPACANLRQGIRPVSVCCPLCDGNGDHACLQDGCDNVHKCGRCIGSGEVDGKERALRACSCMAKPMSVLVDDRAFDGCLALPCLMRRPVGMVRCGWTQMTNQVEAFTVRAIDGLWVFGLAALADTEGAVRIGL